jgi:hypothetical protein
MQVFVDQQRAAHSAPTAAASPAATAEPSDKPVSAFGTILW